VTAEKFFSSKEVPKVNQFTNL